MSQWKEIQTFPQPNDDPMLVDILDSLYSLNPIKFDDDVGCQDNNRSTIYHILNTIKCSHGSRCQDNDIRQMICSKNQCSQINSSNQHMIQEKPKPNKNEKQKTK